MGFTDFAPKRSMPARRTRAIRLAVLGVLVGLVLTGLIAGLNAMIPGLLGEDARLEPQAEQVAPAAQCDLAQAPDTPAAPAPMEPPAPEPLRHEGVIQPGDTLSALLCEQLSPGEINMFVKACETVLPITSIRAGHDYALSTLDNAFDSFEYTIDSDAILSVHREGDGFKAERVAIPYEVVAEPVQGQITDSLFLAVEQAGEGAELAIRLADMFGWDVDFVRDVREGDTFRVLVEKRYLDGQFAGYGRILAAEFVNQGQPFQGFLYVDSEGRPAHFDATGKSLQKAFLKAPLHFTRISSGYTLHRKHPITGKVKSHPAIDYAAPIGTPVRAVGDGTVTFAGWSGGAGRLIKLKHGSNFETYYMHLKGYAKGVKKGAHVRQGQIIGYVGSSGMSTGPHLDFRMKKNGSYVNPNSVTTPSAAEIPAANMALFRHTAEQLESRMHLHEPMQAGAEEPQKEPVL